MTPSTPAPIQVAGATGTTDDTSLAQAQANTYFAVSHLVDQMNAAKAQDFLTQWASWKSNYIQGSIGLDKMPAPPKAFVVAYFDDPTTGKGEGFYANTTVQWPYPSQTGGPVVPTPPVPALPKTAPATWFKALGGTVQTATAGDTFPVGASVTAADGSAWVKKASPTPFGTAYFYEKA